MKKTPLLIVLTAVVVVAGSALAIMNKACKERRAPLVRSNFRHPTPRKNWAQLIAESAQTRSHLRDVH